MTLEQGLFWTEDGERLYYRFRLGSTRNLPVILLHGHGEHSGRYLKFFTHLQALQSPIGTFDLRGCGRSSGVWVYVNRFEDYLQDLSSFLDFLKLRHQIQGPIRLFGHSLGGLIALAWARENPSRVSKLVLSSPLFGFPTRPWTKPLINLLNRFLPRWVIQNPVHPPFLTHDLEEVERYLTDPLIRRRITARLVHEMLRYAAFFRNAKVSVPFPVCILMAEEDRVVDPEATREFFQRLEAREKALETFPGFFHEIFNELGQEKAFERLRYYLNK